MRKFYFLLVASLFSLVTFSQSSANYTFTTGSNGSLATDINANALDMSSGTTTLVAAGLDDTRSSLTNIGFEFWFMGSLYTNFSCTENGIVQLGGSTVGASTYLISANTTLALLAPFANDMRVGTDGVVQSKTFGTAPNRVTVIEYKNNMIRYAASAAAGTGTWQVRLYESTGVVEYVYGSMGTNSSAQTAVNVGFGTNTTAGTFVSVDASHVANTSGTFATFTPTANSTVAHLHSTADGSRRWYRFSPTAPASPSGLTFTSVSATGMTVNWTDNSANELGFVLYRSSDGINFSYAAQTAANATSYTQAGLSPTTTYSWRVHSLSEGALSSPATGSQLTAACSGLAGGTYSVGPTGNYASLTAVAAALSNGTTGATIFELEPTYTTAAETFPISFAGGGCTLTGGVIIRPSASVSSPLVISSANTTATMEFNGIRNVTIDGRPGGTGTTSQLTIANTALGSASAVRFINDASNNTLTYLSLQGSANTSLGVVSFVGGLVTGNDNNTISFNQISAAGSNLPINGVYSLGTSSTIDNSGNTVSDNNIFDVFNAGSAFNFININSNNSSWTISNNRLYQTASRTVTTAFTTSAIFITSGTGYTISGNTIGFANAAGTGTTSYTATVAFRHIGISGAFSAGAPASSIQGNTFTAISLGTSSGAATTNGILCGISITGGDVNIGTVTGNIIGASTGTGALVATPTTTQGAVVGINCSSTGTVSIQNNTIGGFTSAGATASVAGGVFGINISGITANLTISNNTIGNSTANNMRAGVSGTTTGSSIGAGISLASTPVIATITNNTIQNFSTYGTGTSGYVRGLFTTTSATLGTSFTITGNTITNLTTTGALSAMSSGLTAAVGIHMLSANQALISGNTISNVGVSNTTATTNVIAAGIVVASSTLTTTQGTTVSRNTINNITNTTIGTTLTAPPIAAGIAIRSGNATTQIENNMITLGVGQTTNTSFVGIWGNHGSAPNPTVNVYHNTINIGGTAASGALPSFGLMRGDYTTTARTITTNIQNNIFVNTRSGGTGAHYAIANNFGATASATGWSSNTNVLNAATSANTGYWTTAQSASAWPTTSGGDAASLYGIPVTFANTATGDLHLSMGTTPTQLESGAPLIAGLTTDFDNQTRPGPAGSVNGGAVAPDLGADEFDGVILDLTPPSITYTALPFTCDGTARTLTATIADPTSGVPTTGAGLPTLYWRINTGAWQAATGTFVSGNTYSFTFGAGAVLSDVVSYYIVAQDNAATPNVGVFPSAGASGFSVNPPAASTPPTTPSSYTINGTLNGIYTVGATGTYPTLTAAVADYNVKCLTGPVTFSLIDASYSAAETFPIVVQPNPSASSTNTLTIKPAAGVSPVISGLAASTSVFVLNGADFVTIDGSNTVGGTTRDLTFRNINTTTNGVVTVWVASQGANAGATNNKILNSIIEGPAPGTSTLLGFALYVGSNTGAANGPDNDNLTIQNNLIRKAYYGIQAVGGTATANVINDLLITGNTIGGTGTDAIGITGLFMGQADNATISGNDIFGITSTANIDAVVLTTGVTNSTFTSNRVRDITNNGTNRAAGVNVNAGTGANLTFANNMMYNIISNGTSGLAYGSYGFYVSAGTGYKFYFNTISLTGDRDAVPGTTTKPTSPSAALMVNFSTAASLDVRNNIFVNSHTAATNGPRSYSIYSTAPNTAFSAIDNNDYFVSGAQGTLGFLGSDAATLTALRTAFGSNLNSISAAPSFVSTTDLHLNANTGDNLCLEGKATPIAGVTTDYDGQTRNATTPDIGADEFVFTAPSFVVNAPAAVCVGGSVNLTAAAVTTATAGSTTVGYTYFTDAACTNALTTPAAVTTSGTYYIKATFTSASGGCTYDQILPVTVTINALPTVSISVTETSGTTANDGTICAGDAATLTASGAATYVWSTTATTAAITESPSTTTTYTVTGTDANGCQNTASTTITVNALPVASIVVAETSGTTNNDGTICAGASASLTASGGSSYSWSNGATTAAITVTPSTTTTYTVTVTDGNGCISTASTTITVNALPITYNVTGGGAYCSGGVGSSIGLSGSEIGVSYELYAGATATGNIVTGTGSSISFGTITTAGTYTVVASNAATGCSATMSGSATVSVGAVPTISYVLNQPNNCNSNNGGATLTLGGAAGPYTFNWTGAGIIQGQQDQTTLRVGAYTVVVTAANGCQATANFSLFGPGGCDICPTIGAVSAAPVAICQGGTATLSATGLADLGISYGIEFVGSATPLANPYNGGTSLATVANGSLVPVGTLASATATATFNTPGINYIYAILSPAPADPACRPSQVFQLNVVATPDVNTVSNQTVCSGGSTAAVNFTGSVTGTVYNWTNSNPSIGLAASGTGDIASFTATNFTNAPVTATITVTPVNNISAAGGKFMILESEGGVPNTLRNQLLALPNVTQVDIFDGIAGTPTLAQMQQYGTIVTLTDSDLQNSTAVGDRLADFIDGGGKVVATDWSWSGCCGSIQGRWLSGGYSPFNFPATPVNFLRTLGTFTAGHPLMQGVTSLSSEFGMSSTLTSGTTLVASYTDGSPAVAFKGATTAISGHPGDFVSSISPTAWSGDFARIIYNASSSSSGSASCPGSPKTFTITVNPTPTVNTVAPVAACDGATVSVPFSGFVPGTVYSWTNSNTGIGLAASGTGNLNFTGTNSGTTPITSTIIVTPSYTNNGQTCTGTPVAFTITINPTPSVNAVSNQVACNSGSTTAVNFGGAVTGTVYNWTNSNASIGLAASGTGNIASFTALNSGTAPVTATITVTPTYTNGGTTCSGTATTFTITVNPSAQVNSVTNQTVCNGANTTAVTFGTNNTGGTTTYSWTNDTPSIGLAASGTGNIAAFAAVNTGTTPVTATITVTPSYTNGGVTCTGATTTFTYTVNPTPTVNAVSSEVVCNGSNTTAVTFSGAVTGTVYNWTNSNTAIGLAASGTGNIASFAATNTTNAPITATITVTPSYTNGGVTCTGTSTSYTITVNPTPTVNAVSNQTLCNGAATTAVTFSGAVTGTVYTWTNNNTSIGLGASGTGNIASFTATNTTSAPVTATITVTPSFLNGGTLCTGTPRTFTITVNPTPTAVATPASQTICSANAMTTIALTGTVTGTIYSWTRDNTTAVTGIAASGTGNISGTLTNTTNAPVTVTFTITPSANGCTGTPITATVLVNPTPNAVATPAAQTICSGSAITTIALTGNVAGTTYSWTRNNTTAVTGIAASGTGNITGTLTNTTTAPVTVTFTITPSANGCTGTPITATVIVNPIPTVNQPANQVVCNRSNTTAVAYTGAVAGTVYSWTNNTPSIGLAASGTGDIAAFTAVNTTQTPVVATITVTPSFTNGGVTCTGTPRTFTITVNPTPIVVATDLFNQRICISDGPVALNATPVGGSWSGIGVSGFNFIPSATAVGNFVLTYTYTNQFGCTSTDTTTAKVSACDERNRSLEAGGAILYPNPNGGQFNIRVNSTRFQFLQMRIYNALGQLVSTKQWNGLVFGQIMPVDMRHLAAGVYTVRIIYDGGNLYEDRGYQMLITH